MRNEITKRKTTTPAKYEKLKWPTFLTHAEAGSDKRSRLCAFLKVQVSGLRRKTEKNVSMVTGLVHSVSLKKD